MLLDPEEFFKHDEKQLAEQWHDRLEQNVRALLRQQDNFVVWGSFAEVFDGVVGVAREKHLRVALKRLHVAGVTSSDSKGSLYDKRVVRAAEAQP
ncbi:MAG: hypothetical protein ACRDSL_19375 [Pseudonocardiaceae bacterium]